MARHEKSIFGKSTSAKKPAVKRSYEAAKIDRLSADWIFSHQTADRDILAGLKTIRSRVRDLEQNNDWARKYFSLLESNVIGRGFVLTLPGVDKTLSREVVKSFMQWKDSADVSGGLGAADQDRLALRAVARDGEGLVRFMRGKDYPDGLGLMYLESDYLDENMTKDTRGDTRIIGGVEVDKLTNAPLRYHLFASHPGDNSSGLATRTAAISADDMLHLYRRERPGQTRAVSWMASSMKSLRMLYGYLEAELVAARIASCKMGFYKIPPGEDFGSDDKTSPISDASPGVFERMPTGWDFVPYDPTHPNANASGFVKTILRQLAGGLNVAYNNFANDLDGVSYSSIRSGTVEERESWKVLQQWFARNYCQRIFSEWVKMQAITGSYGITSNVASQIIRAARWTGRRWQWVDPKDDIATKKEEVAMGITSPSIIAAENGDDYEQIQEQLKADNEIRALAGLNPVGGQSSALQDTALNGAQIAAAVQVITSASYGLIPFESVGPLLKASFPSLDDEEIAEITKPLNGFKAIPKAGT